jgi:membrane-bound inhibitor of C-type lysozyme
MFTLGASLSPVHAEEEDADVVASTPAEIIQEVYVCERGAVIPVTYIHADDGYAVATIEGRQVAMARAVSGSGALYVSTNEQESYRWHSQGDEAVLSFLEADHTAEEEILLTDCQIQSEYFQTQI